jgi:hypothetical protein
LAKAWVLVHRRMAWMAASTEEKVAWWDFPVPVTLVLDYPAGFALEALGLLEAPVVAVTGSESPYYIEHLKEFKPSALLIEPVTPERLESTLRQAASGQNISFPELKDDVGLTPREHQVLRLLVRGCRIRKLPGSWGSNPKPSRTGCSVCAKKWEPRTGRRPF